MVYMPLNQMDLYGLYAIKPNQTNQTQLTIKQNYLTHRRDPNMHDHSRSAWTQV